MKFDSLEAVLLGDEAWACELTMDELAFVGGGYGGGYAGPAPAAVYVPQTDAEWAALFAANPVCWRLETNNSSSGGLSYVNNSQGGTSLSNSHGGSTYNAGYYAGGNQTAEMTCTTTQQGTTYTRTCGDDGRPSTTPTPTPTPTPNQAPCTTLSTGSLSCYG
jgi:hypothetical protein